MDRGRGGGRGRGRGQARGGGRGPGGRGQQGGGRGGGRGGGGSEVPMKLAVQENASALANLSMTSPPAQDQALVLRPGFGRVGRKVHLLTNHYALDIRIGMVYQYDLDIVLLMRSKSDNPEEERQLIPLEDKKDKIPEVLRRKVVDALVRTGGFPPGWAHDGKKGLYTANPIMKKCLDAPVHIQVEDDDTGRNLTFQATIKLATTIDMAGLGAFCKGTMPPNAEFNAQEALKVIDIVFRQAAALDTNCSMSGRGIFVRNNPVPINSKLEIWKGRSQSARACQSGVLFNLDMGAGGFTPPIPALDFVGEVYRIRGAQEMQRHQFSPSGPEITKLKKAFKGVKVEVCHSGQKKRRHRVKGLVAPATHLRFKIEGKEVSVAQYFESIGTPLKFGNTPCLDCSNGRKLCYIPMEVCKIHPQKRMKLTGRETSEFIKHAAVPPDRRLLELDGLVRSTNMQCPSAFGVSMSHEMCGVEARVIPPPKLEYGNNKCINVGTKGAWNLLQAPFLRGVELKSWAIVSLDSRVREYKGFNVFLDHLVRKLHFLGIKVSNSPPRIPYSQKQPTEEHIKQGFRLAQEKFGMRPQLLLVIIPHKPADELYRGTKIASDAMLGVASQCVVSTNAAFDNDNPHDKRRDQYCSNVAMKINTKIGGAVCRLAGDPSKILPVIGNSDFMIMGADVTHPTSRDNNEPSIAGVVGSLDRDLAQYASETLVLGGRIEIIPVLDTAVEKLLNEYKKRNRKLPAKIVFYRDGIANNQFQECKAVEIPQIYKGCARVASGYRPKVTFVVVQKRHNTRFFPTDENRDQSSGNILPGTCVDTKICHPVEFDFFLNSHAGIKGTSKAGHYHVLRDENGFGPDSLQVMTYWLCHLYCRCTRSVSYASPAYYAHLAAARGKLLTEFSTSEAESTAGDTGGAPPRTFEVHESLRSSMYYI